MHIDQLYRYLENPGEAAGWLRSLGLEDLRRGHGNLVGMATSGLTLDLVAVLCDQLTEHLAGCSDPDMALNNFDRFLAAARNPIALGALCERDLEALPILLQIFSTSQHLSDLLVVDPESYDLLRLTEGRPVSRGALVEDIASEVEALPNDRPVMAALRRFKRRETLRICYGDFVRSHSLATVTTQISYLADAILEAAVRVARRKLEEKRGCPRGPDGRRARFVVLALGKLGGNELNYSSDIDLIFLYDQDGATDGPRPQSNAEFFERLARDVVKLLSEATELGAAYRVDLRLRPEGHGASVVSSLAGALHYYDILGRTWERQAYIKARPAAGDLDLGREFLDELKPWVYQQYLSRADIAGIKALKRRIEQRAADGGPDGHDVKTGHGGIRDIEFVIQFLQLLNGGDLPRIRTGNTLEAIAQLENVGCLTHQERSILAENYSFLRKIEHRLQIMFDLQTHLLPRNPAETRKLALRMGYADTPRQTALAAFEAEYRNKTELNRKILDHLLHDAFSDNAETEAEVDLVLDPNPPPERIAEVLGRYPFKDVALAYKNLMALSNEKIRFLSARRCRHFLAAIAPQLLRAIAATPDPDSTLVNLEKVSDSLGGKGVLWELFSFNPPTLHLYVEICAFSPFLSSILIGNPGMIDELMDSLVLDKLPKFESLARTLAELCRGAEDLDPILHSFKNAQQLRVGVRDLLGKEDISATTGTLSDIAQVCLAEITRGEYEKLAVRFGQPTVVEPSGSSRPCELMILGMGKFGGRELNYHSDLDLVLLYEADGPTVHAQRSRRGETTTNQHFFSELGGRIIKTVSRLGPYGRLYEVDARLRPTGKSGALAVSLEELTRYFLEGPGQLWERQALCKARVVFGSPQASVRALETIGRAAFERPWRREDAEAVRQMRRRLEEASGGDQLKRAAGGLVDIEFLAQMLQLKHGRKTPQIRVPNTLEALAALHRAGHLDAGDFEFFTRSYRFLRTIESRLRLMNSTARDNLPEDPREREKLARLAGYSGAEAFLAEYRHYLAENRSRFDRIFDAAAR
ncbi:MAG: [protein-PII] uridylyltransferase family protein [Pirellulales bacterium]